MNDDLEFEANVVVRVEGMEKPQRILKVNPQLDAIAHISIEGKSARQTISKLSAWEALRDEGAITWENDPYMELPFQHAITPAMQKRKDEAWRAIEPIVSNDDIWSVRKALALVAKQAEKLGHHKHAVRNWLIEYWQKGITPSALYGSRNKAGGKGKSRVSTQPNNEIAKGTAVVGEKRGADRTVTPGVGTNVTGAHLRIIRVAVKRFYRKNRQATLREAYLKMLRQFFQDAVTVNDRGKVSVIKPDDIITYRQFVYWARKGSDVVTDIKARHGVTFYEKNFRPLLGNVTDDAIGPGYRYQIDATIADVYLLSAIDRKSIIGRPVVYVVIDVWSRLIVGLYVGLENASWTVAMMALYNATVDKVAWCRQYGIEIEPHEWPNSALASTILGDRGEMMSSHADHLSLVLGIDVQNTPPYRADWKSVVERSFGTLPAKFSGDIPAYVPKDFMPRLDKDHRLDATLTLKEFTQVMIHCVLDHNSSTVSGYPMHNDMVTDGVAPIPTELWAWGRKNRMGFMLKHSADKLLFGLLPTATARISASGVIYLGRLYQNDAPDIQAWLERVRRTRRRSVKISYYPHDLDKILVHDQADYGRFREFHLTSEDSTVWKLCVEEVMLNKTKAAVNGGKRTLDVLGSNMTRQKNIDDIIANAEAKKAALGPDDRSNAEIVAGIKDNRRVEKAVNRLQQSASKNIEASPAIEKPTSKLSYARPQLSDLTDDD